MTNGIEQTHHQLLLRGCVEGFLLSGSPKLPHANIAGTKVKIVLFLGLSLPIHAASTAGEHCRGIGSEATNTHWPRGLAYKYTGQSNGGPGLALPGVWRGTAVQSGAHEVLDRSRHLHLTHRLGSSPRQPIPLYRSRSEPLRHPFQKLNRLYNYQL